MTNPSLQAQRRPRRDSRGATMVEFALISIILFSLIFGIIEGALAVRARNAVNNAVDDAARRGAVAGSSLDADWLILNQLIGRGADAVTIEYVVVYNAANGSSQVPSGCVDGTPRNGICNVYSATTLEDIGSKRAQFDCTTYSTSWCPNLRVSGENIGFLGVYVKAAYEPIIDQVFVDMSFDVEVGSLQAIETSGEL